MVARRWLGGGRMVAGWWQEGGRVVAGGCLEGGGRVAGWWQDGGSRIVALVAATIMKLSCAWCWQIHQDKTGQRDLDNETVE